MIGHHKFHIDKLASGDAVARTGKAPCQRGIPRDLKAHIAALGPTPRTSLETFVDLCLSDDEIARYFHVPRTFVSQLRNHWGITA